MLMVLNDNYDPFSQLMEDIDMAQRSAIIFFFHPHQLANHSP